MIPGGLIFVESRSLKYLAEACGGRLAQGMLNTAVARINTDSRRIERGDCFLALPGERFDGHDFVSEAARQGAAAVVVQAGRVPTLPEACAVLVVDNTRCALGQIAARYRRDFELPVVAVGGSNGKTTTKELLASVLQQKWVTLRSEASFNNEVGVPLTLLNLERRHQVAVLEAGTNHPGELAPLVRMIQPRWGVVTSLGREHLEFFGGLKGVVEEEGWLAELLPPDGRLWVNGDSPGMDELTRRARATVARVGFGSQNDWQATLMGMDETGIRFAVRSPRAEFAGEYRVGLLGRHQVTNALLAVAVSAELGLSRAEVERGLREGKPARMRMQLWKAGGVSVLDDAYNANADSMLAALQTLADLAGGGRKIAVLGEMNELGAASEAAHREVGQRVAALGIARLFAVGRMAPVLGAAARMAGLEAVGEFESVAAAGEAVRGFLQPGDWVLIKASRAARLERISEVLRAV